MSELPPSSGPRRRGRDRLCATRPPRVRGAVLVASVLLAIATPWVERAHGDAVSLTRGPYLTRARRTSMTVMWRTASEGTSVVHWGETKDLGRLAVGKSGTRHRVRLTGLAPGKRYFYRVETDGALLGRRRSFRTLDPASDPTFRFAVVGDFGTGSSTETAIEDRIVLSRPRLLMTVGDNAYGNGSDAELDGRLFPQYADLIDRVPIHVALGNHDVHTDGGAPERAAFALGSRGWYSFDSSSAHFVVLDSNDGCIEAVCPQFDWLVADLARTAQPFRFVFFHHTISSCGGHGTDEDLRAAWAPIFAAHGVQLVFMGHDHGYQRSVPIDGVVYVTTGGGGAGLYEWSSPCPEAAVVLDATSVPDASHFALVELGPGAATVSAIDRWGTVRDTFSVAP